jgi:hypothetical protein
MLGTWRSQWVQDKVTNGRETGKEVSKRVVGDGLLGLRLRGWLRGIRNCGLGGRLSGGRCIGIAASALALGLDGRPNDAEVRARPALVLTCRCGHKDGESARAYRTRSAGAPLRCQ